MTPYSKEENLEPEPAGNSSDLVTQTSRQLETSMSEGGRLQENSDNPWSGQHFSAESSLTMWHFWQMFCTSFSIFSFPIKVLSSTFHVCTCGRSIYISIVYIYKCLFNMREKQWKCEKGEKKILRWFWAFLQLFWVCLSQWYASSPLGMFSFIGRMVAILLGCVAILFMFEIWWPL